MTQKTQDIQEERAKEFLQCLGNGKPIHQLEAESELENLCEWCGANLTKGEMCDEMEHYLNR